MPKNPWEDMPSIPLGRADEAQPGGDFIKQERKSDPDLRLGKICTSCGKNMDKFARNGKEGWRCSTDGFEIMQTGKAS